MKLLNLLFKKETAAPMLALSLASGASVALVFARIVWTAELRYGFLVWNLILAWVPVVFALLACKEYRNPPDRRRRWHVFGWSAAWLLFFPNAPYIFTDVIHLTRPFVMQHFWVDLILILICALTGLVLGFVSLFQMQALAAQVFGRVTSWIFVAAAAGLSSVGVYLGRFLRFNSWDVFVRPGRIYRKLDAWMDGRLGYKSTLAFLVLFATFFFLAYVMLYALTHLSPSHVIASEKRELENA